MGHRRGSLFETAGESWLNPSGQLLILSSGSSKSIGSLDVLTCQAQVLFSRHHLVVGMGRRWPGYGDEREIYHQKIGGREQGVPL